MKRFKHPCSRLSKVCWQASSLENSPKNESIVSAPPALKNKDPNEWGFQNYLYFFDCNYDTQHTRCAGHRFTSQAPAIEWNIDLYVLTNRSNPFIIALPIRVLVIPAAKRLLFPNEMRERKAKTTLRKIIVMLTASHRDPRFIPNRPVPDHVIEKRNDDTPTPPSISR